MTVKSEVPAVNSFARLPAGGPAIITVLEKRFKDAIVRKSILATNSRVSGQNFLTVTLYGPVGYVTVDDNALGEDSIHPTQIAREFEWYLFGVPMETSLIYIQNKYGPFGFATGIARTGDRCLYAWQHVERPLFLKAGAVGIRLRLCDAKATEQELLSVMCTISTSSATCPRRSGTPTASRRASPPTSARSLRRSSRSFQ